MRNCICSLIVSVALGGCNTVGPAALRNSRNSFNEAIQLTSDEQLLLNLVRLRNAKNPVFMQVADIAATLELGLSAQSSTALTDNRPDPLTIGGAANLRDNATIKYQPVQGKDFVEQFLSPLSLNSLVLLANSGWPIDRLLKITVQRIGEFQNSSVAGETDIDSADFDQNLATLRALQREGRLQVRISKIPDTQGGGTQVAISVDRFSSERDGIALFGQAAPQAAPGGGAPRRFEIMVQQNSEPTRPAPSQPTEPGRDGARSTRRSTPAPEDAGNAPIVVHTRSPLAILRFLSQSVDHGTAHGTEEDVAADVSEGNLAGALLRVRSSWLPPADAYVKIRYDGRWYYIEDTDEISKATFMLLSQVIAIQASDIRNPGLLLTLPVGG